MDKVHMDKTLWTSHGIAAVTGGAANADWSVSGISIDTRTLEKGDVFVPLKDARDGHDFIPMALRKGAGGVISEQSIEGPHVLVKDSLQALRDMGRARACGSDTVLRIAVTGSVGKTSIKEALATIFSKFGKTHKSLKSYNNHWGAPLTMARMPQDTDYGIFELGMNHAGELTDLSNLLGPKIVLITTVAPVHLAHFDSVEAIADAKAEIIDGLQDGGVAVLNADNAYTDRIRKRVGPGHRVVTFGSSDVCDVTIVTSQTHQFGSNIRLRVEDQQIDVTLSVPGEHWVSNAAACIAVAYAAGLDLRKAAMALRDVRAETGRGETHAINIDGKSITLIDESYNANPTSMRAAINVLGLKPGRRLAVLGDMYELGKDELAMHAGLSEPLEAAGVERVITVGECMRALRGALPRSMRGALVSNWENALTALKSDIRDGDTVLIKGSNATGLSNIVTALKHTEKGDDDAI